MQTPQYILRPGIVFTHTAGSSALPNYNVYFALSPPISLGLLAAAVNLAFPIYFTLSRLGTGKRYYGGCEFVDIAENLARDRVKKLFGAEHANVQPHSGANANTAVYFAMLQPGDTVLG